MSGLYVLLPAFFMYINSTSSAVIDVGSGILSTDGTLHFLPPVAVLSSPAYIYVG